MKTLRAHSFMIDPSRGRTESPLWDEIQKDRNEKVELQLSGQLAERDEVK